MKSNTRSLFIFLTLFFPFTGLYALSTAQITNSPKIDGIVSPGEWNATQEMQISMSDGKTLQMWIQYDETYVYFLAIMEHDDFNDKIILDTSIPHDYFGIEFDNNFDDAIMGTQSSPDDLVMVDYITAGGQDMYSHSFLVFEDEGNNGINNSEGHSGTDGSNIIWEIKKELSSGDSKGYDINLKPGSLYQIMVAFWDDKPPHSAAGFVNIQEGNSQFIDLQVPPSQSSNKFDFQQYAIVFILVGIVLTLLISKRGSF